MKLKHLLKLMRSKYSLKLWLLEMGLEGPTERLMTYRGDARGRTHKTGREKRREMKWKNASVIQFIKTLFFSYIIFQIFFECLHHCSDQFLLPSHVPVLAHVFLLSWHLFLNTPTHLSPHCFLSPPNTYSFCCNVKYCSLEHI